MQRLRNRIFLRRVGQRQLRIADLRALPVWRQLLRLSGELHRLFCVLRGQRMLRWRLSLGGVERLRCTDEPRRLRQRRRYGLGRALAEQHIPGALVHDHLQPELRRRYAWHRNADDFIRTQ